MKDIITKLAKKYPNKATLLLYLFVCEPSGLIPSKDDRDFQTKNLGWSLFGYSPKATRKVNQTLSVKNQKNFNTCVFNGSVTIHEPNENVKLSVRYLVAKAKQEGLINGTGFTDIRTAFKMMQKYGVPEESILPDNNNGDWNAYANVDTKPYDESASKRKIQSYWSVSSRDDILKLLDEEKLLGTGIQWYNGFNQGGGFSWPWVITRIIGWLVGGHFVTIKGYDLNYQGRKVYVCQNTYGSLWGDNGDYYIDMNYLDRNHFGVYTILDVPLDTAKFLNDYDGKNVKGKNSPTIYFIQKGVKKPYLHEMDYFVYNIGDPAMQNFSVVDDETLNKIPTGDNMDITKSLYWEALKYLEQPLNITRVLEAIYQAKNQ